MARCRVPLDEHRGFMATGSHGPEAAFSWRFLGGVLVAFLGVGP